MQKKLRQGITYDKATKTINVDKSYTFTKQDAENAKAGGYSFTSTNPNWSTEMRINNRPKPETSTPTQNPGSVASNNIWWKTPWSVKTPTQLGTPTWETIRPSSNIDDVLKNVNTGVTNKVGISKETAWSPTQTGATTPSPGDDGIWQYDELSPENKAIYDSDPLFAEQFDLVGKQWGQTMNEAVQKALDLKRQANTAKDYNQSQADIAQQQRDIRAQAWERTLQDNIKKQKGNLAYSALSSAPSAVAWSAWYEAIKERAKQLDDFIRDNDLGETAFAKQTAEMARRIQEDLNSKITKQLSDSLESIDRAIADGSVLSEEQLTKIYKDNKDAMIKAFPELTNFAVQQLSDLTTNFMNAQKDLRATQAIFEQNANTYNPEMSAVQWFAVDGNGNQILGANGQPIEIPKEAPIKPTFDEATGQLVTFWYDEFGNITAKATKVAGFETKKPEVKRNIIETKDWLYDVDNNRWIAWADGNTPSWPTPAWAFTPPQWFSSRALWQSIPVQQEADGIKINIPDGTILGECGTLANDYGQNIEWYKWVGNDWASKKANVNSKEPIAWGLVMWTPWSFEENGHIGIVEKVFWDGSFQIFDTNYVGKWVASHRIIKPWDKEYNLIQSSGGFFDPRKVGGSTQQQVQDSPYIQAFNSLTFDKPTTEKNELTKIQDMIIAGRPEQAKLKLETLAKQGLWAEAANKYDATRILVKSLTDVQQTLDALKAKWVDTGLLKWKYEDLVNKFGKQWDPEISRLWVVLKDQLDEIRRVRSWAALTEFEEWFYNSIFPSNAKSYDLNTSTLNGFRDSRKLLFDSYLKSAYWDELFSEIWWGGNSQPSTQSTQQPTGWEVTLEDFSTI